jgi:hypothetical protein
VKVGGSKNDVEAVNWFRKAADQGDAPAQADLGGMYANGLGVAQNGVEAVNWRLWEVADLVAAWEASERRVERAA